MSLSTLSPRARRGLVALAVALPVLSIATLAGAAAWVNAHGGLAANLTALARQTAFLAGGTEVLPATLPVVQAVTMAGEPQAFAFVNDDGDRDGDGFSFALIEPDGGSSIIADGDGGSGSLDRLRDTAKVPTLWFSENGVETVITDPATVAKAREICEPLKRIGGQMGRVGGEMGRNGAELGRRGAELGRYGGRLGELGGRLGGISAQLATTRGSERQRERLREQRDEIRAEMEQVREQMERVRDRMDSEEKSGPRERQRELSRQMRELSKQHREALGQAREGLRQLLHEQRGAGRAPRVGRSI